jgi:hypothetical protein
MGAVSGGRRMADVQAWCQAGEGGQAMTSGSAASGIKLGPNSG